MAKPYRFTPAEVLPRTRGMSIYAEIVTDLLSQRAESMQVSIEGVKPATLRAGLRTAIKRMGTAEVRLAQRGEETFLVRSSQV